MEKEILEILKAMQQDIKGLKESQERLENKIDGVVEQTADLLEFRTQITDTVQQIKILAVKKKLKIQPQLLMKPSTIMQKGTIFF